MNHNVLILTAILLYPNLIKELAEVNEMHKMNTSHGLLKDWQKKGFKDLLAHPFFSK